MIRTITALGALAALWPATALAQDAEPLTVIHAGHLIAAPGEERVRSEVSILVRGDEIEAIESGYVTPDGAEIVDLSSAWVMPGFIDAHVHITNQQGAGRRISAFTEGTADRTIDGVMYAGRTLMAGFTTVQDVGGDIEAVRALRDGVESGDIIGPRLRIAGGAVTPTGGHGDANGWSIQVLRESGSPYACTGAGRRGRDQDYRDGRGSVLHRRRGRTAIFPGRARSDCGRCAHDGPPGHRPRPWRDRHQRLPARRGRFHRARHLSRPRVDSPVPRQ